VMLIGQRTSIVELFQGEKKPIEYDRLAIKIQPCWNTMTSFVSMLTVKTLQHPSHVNMYIHIIFSSLMCLISMHKCNLQVY
jgi:hypothetical protein